MSETTMGNATDVSTSTQRIYKRADSPTWYVYLGKIDGRHLYRSTGCRDRTAALAAAAQMEREVRGKANVETVPVAEIRYGGTAAAYVYFVEGPGGAIKIGCTRNVKVRIESLQTSSPQKLKLLAVIPGGRQLESAMHAAFDDARVEGEWFRSTTALRALIAELSCVFDAAALVPNRPSTRGGRPRRPIRRHKATV